ncbi:MAG TPA: peptidylprolyl isomerase [Gammaproteobacteria bacterium]|nr:peptidylprolyl isomerase [Gammaproteobacteria bacterium]
MARLASLVLVLVALTAPAAQATQMLDRVVAVVNDGVVLQSQLQDEMQQVKSQLRRRGAQMPPEDELRHQVLERLVMKKLQLDAADNMGITVDEATLDAAVRRVAEQNNLSLPQFRDALTRQGMTMAGFRDRLRKQIKMSRLRQREMQQRVNVTPQEIDQFMQQNAGKKDQYHLAHILISVPEGASPQQIEQAKKRAQQIHSQLENGGNFTTLAATYSDSRTALDGGDLGWRSGGELPSPIANRLADMQVGDITQVIRTPSGFHIFKLTDKRKAKRKIVTETHARHILIRPNQVVTDNDARERLASLRQRILNGESFADLARSNSDDKTSASNGGDLGWVDPGTMVPTFERKMNSLDKGQISEPFKTRFGWHIVQVLGRRKQDVTDDYERSQATKQLRQRKEDEELELWLRQLRQNAYVDYRLNQ